MDKLVSFFEWKKFLSQAQSSDSGSGSVCLRENSALLAYGRYLSRAVYGAAIGCAVAMRTSASIVCETSSRPASGGGINTNFVNKMCILPHYAAHRLHPGVEHRHEAPDQSPQRYYIWIYAALLAMSFVIHFPLAIFAALETQKLNEISRLSTIISTNFCIDDDEDDDHNQDDRQFSHRNRRNRRGRKYHRMAFAQSISIQKIFLDLPGSDRFVRNYFAACSFAFVTILAQIFLLDFVFDHKFLDLGVRLVAGDEAERLRRLDQLFPFFSTCHFAKFGSSGSRMVVDAICSLKLNLLNRYIFAALWYVYAAALIVFALEMLYLFSIWFETKFRFRNSIDDERLVRKLIRCLRSIEFAGNINRYVLDDEEEEKMDKDPGSIDGIEKEPVTFNVVRQFYSPAISMLHLTSIDFERLEAKLDTLTLAMKGVTPAMQRKWRQRKAEKEAAMKRCANQENRRV